MLLPSLMVLNSAAASTDTDATNSGDESAEEQPKDVVAPAWIDVNELPAAHVVFDDVPKQRKRRKLINYAMRKEPGLTGGSDWGRVLCFRFQGDRNLDVLEAAVAKAKVDAEVRSAENCQVPPAEAYLPPEPDHSVLVTFDPVHTIPDIRPELAGLLDHDERLSSIRVQDDAPGRFCLEYQGVPADEDVQDVLSKLSFAIEASSTVDDCGPAMMETGASEPTE